MRTSRCPAFTSSAGGAGPWEENLGNHGAVSLSWALGRVVEQMVPSATAWRVQDTPQSRCSLHGVVKGRSRRAELISFTR